MSVTRANVFDLRFINTVKYFDYFKFERPGHTRGPHQIRTMDTADLIQFINELVMLLVRSRAEQLFVSLMLVRLSILYSGKVAGEEPVTAWVTVWRIYYFLVFGGKVWRIYISAIRLSIVSTDLNGFSLVNRWWFVIRHEIRDWQLPGAPPNIPTIR